MNTMADSTSTALVKMDRALPVQSMSELTTVGELLAKSGMFGIKNPAAGFVVAATCHQQGISLVEFLRTYHIVEDKPSMRADAMLAEFRKKGGRYTIKENSVTRAAAEFEFEGKKLTFSFSMDDAKRTGDCFKSDGKTIKHTWERRPEDMLWARMVSRAVRRLCPEICSGVYTPEEVGDFDDRRKPDATLSPEEAMQRAKTVQAEVSEPTPSAQEADYNVCPLELSVEGKSIKGMRWQDMPVEWQEAALNLAELDEKYKSAIRDCTPF